MLTFKSLIISDVDIWKDLLTSVLTFKLLAINDVDFVDLYMRYISFAQLRNISENLQYYIFQLV
jgi:hypothetical protein